MERFLYSKTEDISVLIVDDNDINGLIAENMLQSIGIPSDYAKDGLTALQMLRQKKYDLVLMDYVMPGMNGIEVIEKIRAIPHFEMLPVVALTGECFKEIKQEFAKVGVEDLLKKPLNYEKFTSCLKRYFPLMAKGRKIKEKPLQYAYLNDYRFLKVALENIETCVAQMKSEDETLVHLGWHSMKNIILTFQGNARWKELGTLISVTKEPTELLFLELEERYEELKQIVLAYDKEKEEEPSFEKEITFSQEELKNSKKRILYHVHRFEINPILKELKKLLEMTEGEERKSVLQAMDAAYVFDYEKIEKYLFECPIYSS